MPRDGESACPAAVLTEGVWVNAELWTSGFQPVRGELVGK